MAKVSSNKSSLKKKSKPVKGIRYIAQKLQKYYPKRFPKYSDALVKARIIFDKIKSDGNNVTVRNIFGVERKHRVPKQNKPELPEEITEPRPFYDLGSVASEIEDYLPVNIFIESKISPANLPQLHGGVDNSDLLKLDIYDNYFRSFVNYGNSLGITSSDDITVYFKFTEPVFRGGKWISEIISTTPDGVQCDFGFDSESISESIEKSTEKLDEFDKMTFNELRKKIKDEGISLKKPNSQSMRQALREKANKIKAGSPVSKENLKLVKETTPVSTSNLSDEIKLQELKNKSKELEIQSQKVALEQEKHASYGKLLTMLEKGIITHAQFDKMSEKL